ncbi:MAG: long-chain fatty acid--CoA ligase [Actinobacteria bacterium]|nr:long-chain fatty acid--CoA ligase [Actinomycetota bacterium]
MAELHTVGRMLRHRARTTPARTAIDFDGVATTYRELDERSERLAAGLLDRGLTRGDRVATLTTNSPEHVVVFWACAKAGLILLPLNWRLTAPELAYQLDDAEPQLLLVQPRHEELAAQALAGERADPRVLELSASGLERLAVTGDVLGAEVADDDGLLLIYTSGTTGKPKGALLTHANTFWTNLSLDLTAPLRYDDVVLQILPQFHVGGWNVQAVQAWWKGATVVLEEGFDAARVLDLIGRERITAMMGVPANYLFLAEHPAFADADLTSLRLAIVGGAPMPEALLRTWQERGVAIAQGYGLTEAAPNVLCLPPEDATSRIGFAGKPYLHVEVALRDVATGRLLLGPGEGEVLVRGPNVFAGYWRDAEATGAALVDGWLVTGDIAQRDAEGFYRICDRTKDMLISGGENVYPAEVESVLHEHDAVVEAAVIGVPDDRWGEVGLAVVVLRRDVTEDELLSHCRERLAAYKVPKHVRVVDALPRSSMDKVRKDELRERYAPEVAT